VASGELARGDERWLVDAKLVVAADGGADALDRIGRRADLVVGDLDSADPELVATREAEGLRVERHPVDKEASDTELAIQAAIAAGATELVLLGATGGTRLDHELANLLLLTDPALAGRDVRLVAGASIVRVVHGGGRLAFGGEPGDLVTLLPVGGDAVGVSTGGLRWPLNGATLAMGRSRGLSNEVASLPAEVSLERGTLIVFETSRERSMP